MWSRAKSGPTSTLTRRKFLTTLAACGLASGVSTDGAEQLSDDQFLEELERTTFQYFLSCSNPTTGLVKDRNHARDLDSRVVASIAATGFGLAAFCVADARRWLKPGEARDHIRRCLRFIAQELPHERGFFFHFVHGQTGERQWKCELSSIDTALLLAGVLTCRGYCQKDGEIQRLATEIYDRIEWGWMLNGEKTFSMGWKPETGFLKNRWSKYCELMILYVLAIGSKKHPVSSECWHAWQRPEVEFKGLRFLSDGAPLFVHQFSHAWIDFRKKRDAYANYFENSIIATRAHREFCIDLKGEFPVYSGDVWGITSSDSVKGYVGWGGPPRNGAIDGTIVPCAPAGSLPFLPGDCISCLRNLRGRFGSQSWTRFGFIDAFNPQTGWTGPDIVGIDAGITILMAENLRTSFIWRHFMKNEEIGNAMKLAGFRAER